MTVNEHGVGKSKEFQQMNSNGNKLETQFGKKGRPTNTQLVEQGFGLTYNIPSDLTTTHQCDGWPVHSTGISNYLQFPLNSSVANLMIKACLNHRYAKPLKANAFTCTFLFLCVYTCQYIRVCTYFLRVYLPFPVCPCFQMLLNVCSCFSMCIVWFQLLYAHLYTKCI